MTEVNFLVKKGLTVPKGSASTPSVIFDASDPNTGLYSPGADQVAVATNGTGRLFVSSAGLVGVGTSSPQYLFHARGGSGTAYRNLAWFQGAGTNAAEGLERAVALGASNGGAHIDGWNGTSGSRGGTPLLLQSAGGSVGIGTVSPTATLHLSSDDFIRITRNAKDLIINANYSAGDDKAQIQTDSGMSLAFATNGDNERARIDSSGRLGIGTSSPSYAFHVARNTSAPLGMFAQTDANASKIVFQPVNGANGALINVDWTTGNGYLALGAAGEKVRIDNSGRVGIGTQSPSYKLHVDGSVLITQSNDLLFGTASGPAPKITNSGDQNSLSFFTNGSESVRIDGSKRLLVVSSTNNAGYKLQVVHTDSTGVLLGCFNGGTNYLSTLSSNGSEASKTVVTNGQDLFQLNVTGYDGSANRTAVAITATVDGTPGSNDMPGRLVVYTTANGASSPTERLRIANTGAFGLSGANYGSSGQVLTSQGSASAPQWATVSGGGTILSSGVLRGNGGNGSGTITIASFTGLDFSAATANSRLFVMARTAMNESGNVANTAFIDVRIDTGGSNISRICAARTGAPHGNPSDNHIYEIGTSTIQALASTYHTTNVALRFRAQIDGGGAFYYGDQPNYSGFDGEEAGYTFSYALFSE